ncbi:hypothetical protein HU200_049760 [Digitaria exilis]|uniref:Uncharacterized protein n=1 Tax=Digitaria exilis TaxID=1010633 RepID=A0A835AYG3_9POAL|nr:hypothetical protein HU200_049760 [Digitaria exilis]
MPSTSSPSPSPSPSPSTLREYTLFFALEIVAMILALLSLVDVDRSIVQISSLSIRIRQIKPKGSASGRKRAAGDRSMMMRCRYDSTARPAWVHESTGRSCRAPEGDAHRDEMSSKDPGGDAMARAVRVRIICILLVLCPIVTSPCPPLASSLQDQLAGITRTVAARTRSDAAAPPPTRMAPGTFVRSETNRPRAEMHTAHVSTTNAPLPNAQACRDIFLESEAVHVFALFISHARAQSSASSSDACQQLIHLVSLEAVALSRFGFASGGALPPLAAADGFRKGSRPDSSEFDAKESPKCSMRSMGSCRHGKLEPFPSDLAVSWSARVYHDEIEFGFIERARVFTTGKKRVGFICPGFMHVAPRGSSVKPEGACLPGIVPISQQPSPLAMEWVPVHTPSIHRPFFSRRALQIRPRRPHRISRLAAAPRPAEDPALAYKLHTISCSLPRAAL